MLHADSSLCLAKNFINTTNSKFLYLGFRMNATKAFRWPRVRDEVFHESVRRSFFSA